MRSGGPARAPRRGFARRAFVLVLAAAAGACGRPREPRVTVYVSMDEHVARPVLAAFERESGIRVDALYDSEAAKTTGLAARLRQERSAPQADVFWSSEQAQSGALAREGILATEESQWQPCLRRTRVLVWRRGGPAPPASWWELPAWAAGRRIGMADPRFGTTGVHMGAMLANAESRGTPEAFTAWCDGMHAAGVTVLPSGNAGVVRAVLAGEIDAGLTDSDDVAAAAREGAALEWRSLSLAPDGAAPVVMAGVAAVVQGGPNADAGRRLAHYLGSREVQESLASAAPGFEPAPPGPPDAERATSERSPDAIRTFMESATRRTKAPPA